MAKEDAGAKANRKATERSAATRRRLRQTEENAAERKADLNTGAKSLLRRILGG